MTNRDILISGAGIAGPTLAYWLLREGFTPTLIERAPSPRVGGYMIDFWGVGYDVAERMGLLPVLEQDGYRVERLRMVDANGRSIAGLDVRAFQSATNNRFVSLLRSDLARRILELIDGRVETIFGDTITELREDAAGVTVAFERSSSRRFDLVIGADGLHSATRALTFGGSGRHEIGLGYYAAAFTTDSYPEREEGAYISFSVPGRQIARYALRDGRSAFFFVFAHEAVLPTGHANEAAQRTILRQQFSGLGWECDDILARMDTASDLYFDVMAQVRLPTWSCGRVTLLGDAACCPSLLAGQGAALAMAGAYVLANALTVSHGDYQRAYDMYQREFKPFMDAKQRAAARNRWWFAPRTAAGLRLRDSAMRILALPYVGNFLIGRSLGDHFILPA